MITRYVDDSYSLIDTVNYVVNQYWMEDCNFRLEKRIKFKSSLQRVQTLTRITHISCWSHLKAQSQLCFRKTQHTVFSHLRVCYTSKMQFTTGPRQWFRVTETRNYRWQLHCLLELRRKLVSFGSWRLHSTFSKKKSVLSMHQPLLSFA